MSVGRMVAKLITRAIRGGLQRAVDGKKKR